MQNALLCTWASKYFNKETPFATVFQGKGCELNNYDVSLLSYTLNNIWKKHNINEKWNHLTKQSILHPLAVKCFRVHFQPIVNLKFFVICRKRMHELGKILVAFDFSMRQTSITYMVHVAKMCNNRAIRIFFSGSVFWNLGTMKGWLLLKIYRRMELWSDF